MTDTPLYCPCGRQLGTMRPDGTFVCKHKGRVFTVSRTAVSPMKTTVRCEQCEATTEVDMLRRVV